MQSKDGVKENPNNLKDLFFKKDEFRNLQIIKLLLFFRYIGFMRKKLDDKFFYQQRFLN